MEDILLYHGSGEIVEFPEIRKKIYKDFFWGFYCTINYEQAYKWANKRSQNGFVNVYKYTGKQRLKNY